MHRSLAERSLLTEKRMTQPTRIALVAVGRSDLIARYYTDMIARLGDKAPASGFETKTFTSSEPAVAFLDESDGGRVLLFLSSGYKEEADRVAIENPDFKVRVFAGVHIHEGAAKVFYKNQITPDKLVEIIT